MVSTGTPVQAYSFLNGGGETVALLRAYDWAQTPLGPFDRWPASLRTTLGILFHSQSPMALFWGDELRCFYNDAYRPALGMAGVQASTLGSPARDVFTDSGAEIHGVINRVLTRQEAVLLENQPVSIDRNGRTETAYWTFSYSPVYTEFGLPAGVFVTCTETTQAVRTQQQLVASKKQALAVFDQAPVGVALISADGLTFQLANQCCCELIDRKADHLIGRALLDVLPELAGQGFDALLRNVLETGRVQRADEVPVTLRRYGQLETVYVDYTLQLLQSDEGGDGEVLVMLTDATTRVVDRQALAETEARFRALVEEAPVATCLFVGRELRIEVANQVMLNIWGKGNGVLNKPLADALPELNGQPFPELLDRIYTTGEPYSALGTPVDLLVDGRLKRHYFDFTYKPLRDTTGAVYAIIDMAIDVTEQVLAKQKLEESENRYRLLSAELEVQVQARTAELEVANEELRGSNEEIAASNEEYAVINEELEEANGLLLRSNDSLEKFAYVASHDLQEPLRKIQQFGDLLKTRYADAATDEFRYLERMQLAASRMSTLIRDLLNFSRISVHRDTSGPVSLNDIISSVLVDLELTTQETDARIEVGALPMVAGDPLQLGQLFLNLLSNALKFRQPDQTPCVRITSAAVTAPELPPSIRPNRLVNAYYRIDVADNGIGFDDKYVDRIFQIFQRLHGKSAYTGTGIGLAICERVAINHGGGITAVSQPGQGATFTVYLPA